VKKAEGEVPGEKFSRLLSLLGQSGSAVLAFSGGVDSSFLLKAMTVSGAGVLAVTAVSETMPERDLENARLIAGKLGAAHRIIRTDEMSNESFVRNPADRCFFCKDELFGKLSEVASRGGYAWVCDGSNADDLFDYRPGRRAAALHGVRSPLAECGFSKDEVREMSRKLGLETWNRPSSPCLSSRFPYGQRITREALRRVARAEDFLLNSLGIHEVRVRDHGDTARIEADEGGIRLLLLRENRIRTAEALKSLGYRFIALDLEGYKTGSMNRMLGPDATGRRSEYRPAAQD